MKRRDNNRWIWPAGDQWLTIWSLPVLIVVALVTSQVSVFFLNLTGTRWVWCYGIASVVGLVGVGLLFYAKLPLYRQRRFLTFGAKALPEERRPFYRWGYRCAIFSIVVLAFLIVTR